MVACAALAAHATLQLSPRQNGLAAAVSFGGGFLLSGLAVHLHNLPLLYLGYGFFGGLGIALGYVPAVKVRDESVVKCVTHSSRSRTSWAGFRTARALRPASPSLALAARRCWPPLLPTG